MIALLMLLPQIFPFFSHDLDWKIKSEAGITKSRALRALDLAKYLLSILFSNRDHGWKMEHFVSEAFVSLLFSQI